MNYTQDSALHRQGLYQTVTTTVSETIHYWHGAEEISAEEWNRLLKERAAITPKIMSASFIGHPLYGII